MWSAQIDVQIRALDEVSVLCMPGEVQQIFANLISNAIDAMPREETENTHPAFTGLA